MPYLFLLIILSVCLVIFITLKKIHVKTSSMAAVMSLGIMIQGVLLNYFGKPFFLSVFGKLLSIINLALWLAFILSFFMVYAGGKFKELHYSDRINRFGIGTWIAGTSISTILIYKQFNHLSFIPQIITYVDIGMWVVYMCFCLYTFIEIFRTKLFSKVHGILLLTTVSTQSIVLVSNTVFDTFPSQLNILFLIIGFCFYFIGILFILYRYCKNSWSIEFDWNNTNCILHGALSISGIACIITDLVNDNIIECLWLSALIIFLFVESIEIYRLIKRIQKYGLKRGLFIYDVTQWARIFTFAMFYTFTSSIKTHLEVIVFLKKEIVHFGIWFVISLLFIELLLCLSFNIRTYFIKDNRNENEVTSHF
ncbi:hypothetical protein [Bacillus sp. NEB1478]|uniref:hypothetical protein n=1 Tax=Bacillus sp. NEB1478 TaxID=3073816 RepID=UPI0028736F09|nr:hypothetical protein [Bacillus sp. NEB1478]WNB92135.1 hypothetical protein RGB74_00295 [Bacillus sp. NEB1478]